MIEYRNGDLFDSGCQILVNPVNCVGVMGAGLALQFKQKYPAMFAAYRTMCARRQLQPGGLQLVKVSDENPKWIVNLATKDDWRKPSQLSWVEEGLQSLRQFLRDTKAESAAVPALGCGYGSLSWSAVQSLIEQKLGGLETKVLVFPPQQKRP